MDPSHEDVDRELVVDYLKEMYELKPKHFVRRELRIKPSSNIILSIYGPRRSGKSYFLRSFIDDHTIYLDFDDIRLEGVEGKDTLRIIELFEEIFGKHPRRILLDEIQNVKSWEKVVRTLFNKGKYEIMISGSSSRVLKKEIHTSLRGRILSYLLLPFSFREFLMAKGMENIIEEKFLGERERAKLKRMLREYMRFGGIPEILNLEDKARYLSEYIDLIIYKDFVDRHKIRNISFAKFLVKFLLKSSPSEVSPKTVFDRAKGSGIKVSKDTVYEVIDLIEDTCFFFFLPRISEKIHVVEGYPKKVFIADVGPKSLLRFEIDKAMELVVFQEILRLKNKNPTIGAFYSKEPGIDFIIRRGNKKAYMQVTYEIDDYEREVRKLKRKGGIVITWDEEGEDGKVKIVPLYKFLMDPKAFIL